MGTSPSFVRGQVHILNPLYFRPYRTIIAASRFRPTRSQRVDIGEGGWDLSEELTTILIDSQVFFTAAV